MIGYILAVCVVSVMSRDIRRDLSYHEDSPGQRPIFHVDYNPRKEKVSPVIEGYKYAECDVEPNPSKPTLTDRVQGQVHFKQRLSGGKTMMYIQLSGFNTTDDNSEHGFHIHAYGTIKDGCEGAGGHYNPYGSLHGSVMEDQEHRHVGDLGNIVESSDGTVVTRFTDDLVSLEGVNSVMGRAVVVHQKKDDLGKGGNAESLKTGNAGTRLACCIISATAGDFWGAN